MRILSIFLMILFSSNAAIAQTRTVVAGMPFKLHEAYATNPDCSSVGDVVIRVVSPPSSGRVSIAEGVCFQTSRRPMCAATAIGVGFQAPSPPIPPSGDIRARFNFARNHLSDRAPSRRATTSWPAH